jgi:hypothetical protein
MVSMLAPALLLRDFDYFAALVLSAVRANAMRHFGLVAIGAFGQAGGRQGVVRAAGAGPLLGVSTFRIRHFYSFNNGASSRLGARFLKNGL